ncbi:FAD-dependent oxidoreductase [Ponticaulis sp.]|uniref:NAD(P)/FAD-dependent oxidoreductase n=1 Tax=Ponticaulis sp. TaxID=2020902 RepID=UPI000B6FB082|nr:FAD-dependent oxidoreductase [Ponticaulis sp.]MAJ09912.1 NAD/FAD-dependent oxidoreductase [Ponticaulis sp.]RPG18524.1 MAG: FAD-binding protein [Hyphomonadaceae bacterium TMED125]HBJ94858.1 NAD/FAD-dependent oxidoreductase [Hyphomonadaceae bacterium]
MKLAIIGAGFSGLTCARIARQNGLDVTVFDKGRGAGGRLSTKRISADGAEYRFDHGTSAFDARSEAFADALQPLIDAGFVAELHANDNGFPKGFVGTPGMNSTIKGLAEGLDVRFGQRVERMTRTPRGWALSFEQDIPPFDCDVVVCAIPAEQATILLADAAPEFSAKAGDVVSEPRWVTMLGFSTPLPVDFTTLKPEQSSIAAIIRNQTKPGRDATKDCLVLHASTDWSKAHLEDDASDVLTAMKSALAETLSIELPSPAVEHAHRWRYAVTSKPAGEPFMLTEDKTLGVCGDWLLGGGVEDAWASGKALGGALSGAAD